MMDKYITDERTGLKYELVGDYYLIAGDDEPEEDQPIGVWGQRHLRYLKKHHRVRYANLLTSGKLNSHLAEIQQTAQRRMELSQRDPSAEHARLPFPIHFDPSIPAGFPFEKGKIKKSIDKSRKPSIIIYVVSKTSQHCPIV